MPWNNGNSGQGNGSGNGSGGGQGGNAGPGNGSGASGGSGGPWGGAGSGSGGSGGGTRPPGGDRPSSPPPGGGKRPPGSGGFGGIGTGKPPELDELLRRGQFHFNRMFSGGPAQQNLIGIAVAVIGTLWLMSGFYRVQPDEQAIPKVFGKANPDNIVGPGLHYIWPVPIGSVVISRTGSENRIEIPSGTDADGTGGLRNESLMLTRDENIIDIKFVVRWKINDPFKYEFDIRDQEHTITRAAESAIREIVGQTPIQAALTEGREQVAADTRTLLQKMLDEYQAGVTVDGIDLIDVSPPEPVRDAFNDVQRALSDADRTRNDAEAYANSILPRARGDAASLGQQAIGYKAQVINRAKGDADRFRAVYAAYAQAKDVTEKRMYLETMEEVLRNARKIITDTPAGTPVILPYASPGDAGAPAAAPAPSVPSLSNGGQR